MDLKEKYFKSFGVRCTESEVNRYSEEQLYLLLRKRHLARSEHQAAIKIQALARMLRKRREWLESRQSRNDAARTI